MSLQMVGMIALLVLSTGALLGVGFGRATTVGVTEPNIGDVPRKRLNKMLKEWARTREETREAYWKQFRRPKKRKNN